MDNALARQENARSETLRYAVGMQRFGLVLAVLALIGCSDDAGAGGGDDDGQGGSAPNGSAGASALLGTWRGTWMTTTLTIELQRATNTGTSTLVEGNISTNLPACFTVAAISGTVIKTTVQLAAVGSGSTSPSSAITLSGELRDDELTGQFDLSGHPDAPDCYAKRAPITLTR